MQSVVELGPVQRVDERPFADIAHNTADLAAMQRIVASLTLLVGQPLQWPEPPQPLVVRGNESGKLVRVVVCNRAALLANEPVFVVGFFGHRRTDLDTTILNAVDDDLIHEFPLHAGLLSYSSFELEDGNYVNVVLLQDAGAKEDWRTSSRHAYAARELAPDFYVCIRLQNATLPNGLASPEDMRLVATKYYDYQQAEPWLALRQAG
jgi:hypothetical protein